MHRQRVDARPRIPLLVQSILDGRCRVICRRVWGRPEPHAAKVVVDPAVDTFTPGSGIGATVHQRLMGARVNRQVAIDMSRIGARGVRGGDNRGNAHAAGHWRDEGHGQKIVCDR